MARFASLLIASAVALLSVTAYAADDPPRARVAVGYSFGYTRTVIDKAQLGQTPPEWPIGTTMGVGIDVRGGIQLTRWLAVDAQLFGESMFFFGQGRAAALVEIKPVERFAVSAGIGYGQIWLLNFARGPRTSNYAMLLLRPEVVWRGHSHENHYALGVELQLGRSTGGTVGEDHLVLGGRVVFSILVP